jgi:hypothetical protein
MVTQYCVTCHNDRAKTGNLSLDHVDLSNVSADAEMWEKVVRKLRTGAMPPQGVRRPEPAVYASLIASLEGALDRAVAAQPNPGRPLLHRLNRAEYANAVRDVLGLDHVNVNALLPADNSSFGFDNIADVLGVSPLLLERYIDAAGKLSALAVGSLEIGASGEIYRLRQDLSQDQHVEGLPIGTVGGTARQHYFPLDGEYSFQVKMFRTNLNAMRGLERPNQVEITVDGEQILLVAIGGEKDLAALYDNAALASDQVEARLRVRVPVKAGLRTVTAAFLQKPPTQDTRRLENFLRSSADTIDYTGRPHIESLTVTGPFNPTGPGDTASRRRIFICRPTGPAIEDACARQIVGTLARRAYRQPVSEPTLRDLMGFYQEGRRKGTFDTGIEMAVRRILASPRFVFRVEADRPDVASGVAYRISDLELASRLSFFLWSSIPDDELVRVAAANQLRTPAVLAQQVRRMLADPKAKALVDNFAGQWLQLRNLQNILPNSDEYPDFDDNLRQSLGTETELFFGSIIREDRSVLDLLTADYTFVNERLARHYGMPNIYGSHFRRVAVASEARRGLLGQGSVLTVTSHAQKTSPVLRGKWILENLLGSPPPEPPPNVPALEEKNAQNQPRSMREQMEAHRANAVCATCHKLMDPIGFALENFDAVGAWRTRDAGATIDASSELFDGTKIDGAVALRRALMTHSDVVLNTITEKLLTYALGRGLGSYDMPAVRAIVRDAARQDYKFSSIVLGIANSTPFKMRINPVQEGEGAPVQSAAR